MNRRMPPVSRGHAPSEKRERDKGKARFDPKVYLSGVSAPSFTR